MGISLTEATRVLLGGKELTWKKFKDYKGGSITLDKPEQRRLLEFLLATDSRKVVSGDETLFAGLVEAWEDKDHDPAKTKPEAGGLLSRQSLRLDRVEASGFGGLTIFGGKPFDLYVGGNNWCLEGQNGSGKTSLVSAILWALTGKRIRDHEGPVDERGEREDVESDEGAKIGNWPPLAAYPTTIADLGKQAEVWVRLTFKTSDGDTATAYRRMIRQGFAGVMTVGRRSFSEGATPGPVTTNGFWLDALERPPCPDNKILWLWVRLKAGTTTERVAQRAPARPGRVRSRFTSCSS